jgi:hypothetical protein
MLPGYGSDSRRKDDLLISAYADERAVGPEVSIHQRFHRNRGEAPRTDSPRLPRHGADRQAEIDWRRWQPGLPAARRSFVPLARSQGVHRAALTTTIQSTPRVGEHSPTGLSPCLKRTLLRGVPQPWRHS